MRWCTAFLANETRACSSSLLHCRRREDMNDILVNTADAALAVSSMHDPGELPAAPVEKLAKDMSSQLFLHNAAVTHLQQLRRRSSDSAMEDKRAPLDLQKWAAEASAAGSPPWESERRTAEEFGRAPRLRRMRSVSPGPTSRQWPNTRELRVRPRSIHGHQALPASDSVDTLHSPASPKQPLLNVSLPPSPYPSAPSTLSRASALKIKARPTSLRTQRPQDIGEQQHVRFEAASASNGGGARSEDDYPVTPRATIAATAELDRPPLRQNMHLLQATTCSLDRGGGDQGLGALGASADVSNLIFNLDGRRGGVECSTSAAVEEDVFGGMPLKSVMRRSLPLPNVPHISQASLLEIGRVEGITPPTSSSSMGQSDASLAPLPELSTVVSAGLEMGLGVHLATSALHNNLPGASAAVSSLAEPRFARPATIDFNAISLAAKLTEREIWTDDNGPRSSVLEDPTSVAFEHAETQLSRRRTTGSAPASTTGRRPVPEVTRAGPVTHDFSSSPKVKKVPNANLTFTRSELEAPSSVSTPSIDYSASTGERHRVSGTNSTQIGTPSLHDRAMLSPATSHHMSSAGDFLSHEHSSKARGGHLIRSERRESRPMAHHPVPPHHQHGGLIGVGGGGHFGPGVRAKVLEVLDQLIAGVPLDGDDGKTVTIAEYGSLQGRSLPLMQPIISRFSAKAHAGRCTRSPAVPDGFFGPDDMHTHTVMGAGRHMDCAASRVNFSLIHEDIPQADFRPLMQQLDNTSESYLNPIWQSHSQPSLQNMIFSSFVARPFASRIAPPNSIYMGLSLMDLHWSHTPPNPAVSMSTTADAELTAFLSARAHEFKQGGALILAYIARSDDDARLRTAQSLRSLSAAAVSEAPLPSKRRSDLWTMLTNMLAPCIQRLVSCGMLKSDVARHMLSLPLHPRTAKQTIAVLKSVQHQWDVEWSCGLGQHGSRAVNARLSEPDPVRIAHPAWKALEAGTLSHVAFAEHMIQLFKNLYESHFRALLREKGKLSKGAVEFVLDSLWDVLHSRIGDENSNLVDGVELEVCICALRRL
ncbi:hypothetical protein K437DRAFT_49609 [Tilletiaria anomala UBC 951]|uniref:Uncharacterized protein n=1 Tax=Tilletiaria anomala (strain ATCC 24038 / CBS 436.72 / UBC 951) TaxID=1037660 RepID=A0A066WCC5_TILAU|nr:uncharacterized protein K437DRAFT_49609 [Tilletiaria anomala UBC 951]KDN51371.1 hypothetical protein K437DRAFT_49609 [Tilletiaria anomala UBC 951]